MQEAQPLPSDRQKFKLERKQDVVTIEKPEGKFTIKTFYSVATYRNLDYPSYDLEVIEIPELKALVE